MREEPAFKIKNANFTLLVLHVIATDMEKLKTELETRLTQTPDFFSDTPIVLGLVAIAEAGIAPDFADLVSFMRAHGMWPVGVAGGSPEQRAAAVVAGLGLFPEASARLAAHAAPEPEPVAEPVAQVQRELPGFETVPETPAREPAEASSAASEASAEEEVWAPPFARPTLVVDKPVRTGQRIYAEGADLVVLAIVNAGAELIADGDIHVYAPLRGRAIAGARGNEGARVFVQRMEAELISIAGCFQVFEEGVPEHVRGKPAQVHLEGTRLVFERLPV